jgi:DNA-directed RNA polymerase subunit A'
MFISKQIGGIEFRVLSPHHIRKLSAMEVVVSELYDQDGFPVEGGLMDPRLGVVDPGFRCRTCAGKVGECPGHLGYVDLARPVIHVKFAEIVHKVLNSTCKACGRIKMKDSQVKYYQKLFRDLEKRGDKLKKWEVIEESLKIVSKVNKCPHCGEPSVEIKLDKPTTFYEDKHKITPLDIREWLEKILDTDLRLLGLKPEIVRPEWMVLTTMLVLPVTIRPSITLETGERAEDDLTHKLVDIMRINMRLKENMTTGAPTVIVEDLWELLQYHVTTFIDNEISGIPPARHRAGRELKGIAQRIKSKEGRFRHNLAGKRVNFSARTVISPDSRIDVDEVGVPVEIAKELTIPEIVTEHNIERLKKLIMEGSEQIVGVNYVLTPDGRRKRVTDETKETISTELAPGMIVERHMATGDSVIFNRQPSLHKASIMVHKARVLPYHSFRVNPAVCPPYNADFDGDEMNLHVPQNPEAISEAMMLMSVSQQLRSVRYGGPIVGGVQDHISGIYLLTKKGTVFTREEAAQLLFEAGVDVKLPKGDKITGKELFSLLIPPEINIEFEAKTHKYRNCPDCPKGKCEHDSYVRIEKGKLISGALDKVAIGSGDGKLIDEMILKKGPEAALDFLTKLTNLSLIYLRKRGISVGLDDFQVSAEAHKKIEGILVEGETEVDDLIKKFNKGNLEPWPGLSLRDTLEAEIMSVLNRARDRAVKVVGRYLSEDNTGVMMAITGARGKLLNIAQMTACLGQQAIGGTRVVRGYRNRTLPHFKHGDLGAVPHGFVHNSYGSGLNPFEFFWVAMAGREGLTDTSMRTPKSGYMYRRLANALQDLKVEYDSSVRDNRGVIIQFEYGEDGVYPAKSRRGKVI